MTSPRATRRFAVLSTAALAAAVLTPSSAAGASSGADASLDARCLDHYEATYEPDAGLVIEKDADALRVRFPTIVSENITAVVPSVITLTGPLGSTTVDTATHDRTGITIDVPDGFFDGSVPGKSLVDLTVFATLTSNPCSPDSEYDDGYPSDLSLRLQGTIVDGSGDAAVWDLQTTAASNRSGFASTEDWSSRRVSARWGGEVAVHGEPGFFLTGPENRLDPVTVTARLWSDLPDDYIVALDPPSISADGSTATFVLPAAHPESSTDAHDGPEDAKIRIALSSASGGYALATVALTVADPDAAEIVAVRPIVDRTPRLWRAVKADAGAWGPEGVQLSYQWLRDGRPIAGATAASYTPRLRDYGKSLSVRVTGALPGSESVTLTSTGHRVRLL